MVNHLYLSGIKHSGKTSIAASLSPLINRPWVDLDQLIEENISPYTTVRDFYKSEGQKVFQEKEKETLQAFLKRKEEAYIIALGGGACDNNDLMEIVKESGLLLYLVVESDTLYERILRTGLPPFLDSNNPRASFDLLYERRHELYSKSADILIQLPVSLSAEQCALYVYKKIIEEL